MNCEEACTALSTRLDGEALPIREERALEEHLEGCLECQGEVAALEQVSSQVRALPRLAPPAHFGAQVMAQLVAEAPPAAGGAPAGEGGEGEGQDGDCAAIGAELSALLDEALDGDAFDGVQEHLAECDGCGSTHDELERVVQAVRSLPRIAAPEAFVGRVMAAVAAEAEAEVERARSAQQARLALWTQLGRLAQAACLLAVLGAGLSWSTPAQRRLASVPDLPPMAPAPPPERRAPEEAAGAGPSIEAVAPGPYDGTFELDVRDGGLAAAVANARVALGAYRVEGEASDGPRGYAFVAAVPANRVDDLLAALAAAPGVEARPAAQRALERIHTEQDRVQLKNGFVLRGAYARRGRDASLQAGPTQHPLEAEDVEAVEAATTPRRVRVMLRATRD